MDASDESDLETDLSDVEELMETWAQGPVDPYKFYEMLSAEDPLVSQSVYVKTCKKLNILPNNHFCNSLCDESVVVAYTPLKSKDIKAMCTALGVNRIVRTFILIENVVNTDGLLHLARLLMDSQHLKKLIISGNCLSGAGLKLLLEALGNNYRIKHLDLSRNAISDKDGQALSDFLRANSYVKKLILSGNLLNGHGATLIGLALEENEVLKFLDLSDNTIRQDGLTSFLKSIQKNDSLQQLNLSSNGFDELQCREVGQLLQKNHTLQVLDISNCRITLENYKYIRRGLSKNCGLKQLILNGNPITAEQAIELIKSLRNLTSNCVLVEVDLSSTVVTAQFTEHANQLFKNKGIRVQSGMKVRDPHPILQPHRSILDTNEPDMAVFEFLRIINMRAIDFFNMLDRDKTGYITLTQILDIFKKNHITLTVNATSILNYSFGFARSPTGGITNNEFVELQRSYWRRQREMLQLRGKEAHKAESYRQRLEQIHVMMRMRIRDGERESVAQRSMSKSSSTPGGYGSGPSATARLSGVTSSPLRSSASLQRRAVGDDKYLEAKQRALLYQAVRPSASLRAIWDNIMARPDSHQYFFRSPKFKPVKANTMPLIRPLRRHRSSITDFRHDTPLTVAEKYVISGSFPTLRSRSGFATVELDSMNTGLVDD